jgi:4-amino-4-deoxy-L-arabinose transferase-like glycosyltransferase
MNNMSMTTTAVADPASAAARCDDPSSVRNGILCVLLVAVCAMAIYPVVDGPWSDDFSYIKTALDFERTGKVLYNGWATAMLGWLIPWGALFIKLFGFSFTILRVSLFPIAAATIYLLHQILRRFGIDPQNADFGTLAIGLSPLFLLMATNYMTDVPGLLVILVCIYMCQRAVAARTDNRALLWLIECCRRYCSSDCVAWGTRHGALDRMAAT